MLSARARSLGDTGHMVRVGCNHCSATWECSTDGVCSYCDCAGLVDATGGADNAVCVGCLTFQGDGVGHANVCDHDACACFAKRMVRDLEASAFDAEMAIYYHAAHNHDGQTSALYSILSTSPYKPGMMERDVTDNHVATALYDALGDGRLTVEGLRAAVAGVSHV